MQDVLSSDIFYEIIFWFFSIILVADIICFFIKKKGKANKEVVQRLDRLHDNILIVIKDQMQMKGVINSLEKNDRSWYVSHDRLSEVYEPQIRGLEHDTNTPEFITFLHFKFEVLVDIATYLLKLQRNGISGMNKWLINKEFQQKRILIIEASKKHIGHYFALKNEAANDTLFALVIVELHNVLFDKTSNDKENRILKVLEKCLLETAVVSSRIYKRFLDFRREYYAFLEKGEIYEACDILAKSPVKLHRCKANSLEKRYNLAIGYNFTDSGNKEQCKKELEKITKELKQIKL